MFIPASIYDTIQVSSMSNNDSFQHDESKFSSSSSTSSDSSVAMNCFGEMRKLPQDFTPGPFDVICARGKKALQHPGNMRFRSMIQENADIYEKTTAKRGKSQIVLSILTYFRERSDNGGFVCELKGAWYDVGDQMAREKCGQTFRDALHTKYKSSTKAKSSKKKTIKTIPNDNTIISMDEQVFNLNASKQELAADSTSQSVAMVASANCELGFERNEAIFIQHERLTCRQDSIISSNNNQNMRTNATSNFEMFPVRQQNTLIMTMPQYPDILSQSYQDLAPLQSESRQYDKVNSDQLCDWMTDTEQQQLQQNLPSDFFDWDIDTLF